MHKYSRGYKTNFLLMDYQNEEDIITWCEIINASYEDAKYDKNTARNLLLNHPFIHENQTSFYVLNERKVATISYGFIKEASNVGGFFRIAVLPAFRGKKIGRKLLSYAEIEMRKRGAERIEEAIKLTRIPSLMMHFSAGYLPEKRQKERACPRDKGKAVLLSLSGYDFVINYITNEIYKWYLKTKEVNNS